MHVMLAGRCQLKNLSFQNLQNLSEKYMKDLLGEEWRDSVNLLPCFPLEKNKDKKESLTLSKIAKILHSYLADWLGISIF